MLAMSRVTRAFDMDLGFKVLSGEPPNLLLRRVGYKMKIDRQVVYDGSPRKDQESLWPYHVL